ncbi:ankyrin repeat domain-containing protein [Candidatus Mesenet endosymbiont of Phosphuga atrata]|uniref:ankyrin repeat domain-containing protein n=1 Tax=Candidatus Mesenet endosymbiont of Phosphuga atrata TaxID=3066221 RepID=UPI0030D4BAB2
MFNWIKKILLHWAARKGYTTIARLLIRLGADIDNILSTDSQAADYNNHMETLKSILNKGVDADSKGKALLFAAANDHKEIVRLLLDKALFTAAGHGHKKTVELLLNQEVDASHIGQALLVATLLGHKETVELLLGKEV